MVYDDFGKAKKRFFEVAIELFARYGFENVSLSDIADALGKNKSGMYNHFNAKQDILDCAYTFFKDHFFDKRKPIEAFKPLIQHGSLIDIISAICFPFPPEHYTLLMGVFRIVHQRKYFDDSAEKIFKEVVTDECIAYVTDVLDFTIAKKRTAPFDTANFAMMINYTRLGTYTRWILEPSPERCAELLEEEKKIFINALSYVEDLRKSNIDGNM